MFFFVANARDNVVKDNFPLKQEGSEQPHAQGDNAGKCLILEKSQVKQSHLNLKVYLFLRSFCIIFIAEELGND